MLCGCRLRCADDVKCSRRDLADDNAAALQLLDTAAAAAADADKCQQHLSRQRRAAITIKDVSKSRLLTDCVHFSTVFSISNRPSVSFCFMVDGGRDYAMLKWF